MHIQFTTYSGKPYSFDPIRRKITPIDPSGSQQKPWTGGDIFKKMRLPSAEDIRADLSTQKMLQLNVTEECSNRCSYCVFSGHYTYERAHAPKFMSRDIIRTAISNFLTHATTKKTPHISFYGGEALMPGAVELVKEAVNFAHKQSGGRQLTFGLTTNGRHFTDENIRFLAEHDFQIMVSLDGPQEIHDRYRRSKEGIGTFAEVMSGLERLEHFSSTYYQRTGFICVLTPPLDIPKVRHFFNENRHVRGHALMVSSVNLHDQQLPITIDEQQFAEDSALMYREAIKRYYECATAGTMDAYRFEQALLNKNLGLLKMAQDETGTDTIGPNGCCIPGAQRCFVNTDGQLYACEKVAGFKPIGEAQNHVDPERTAIVLAEYRDLSLSDCMKCWCGNICDLCFYSARKGSDFNAERKRGACQERRDFFKALIRLYASLHESGGENLLNRVIPSVAA